MGCRLEGLTIVVSENGVLLRRENMAAEDLQMSSRHKPYRTEQTRLVARREVCADANASRLGASFDIASDAEGDLR